MERSAEQKTIDFFGTHALISKRLILNSFIFCWTLECVLVSQAVVRSWVWISVMNCCSKWVQAGERKVNNGFKKTWILKSGHWTMITQEEQTTWEVYHAGNQFPVHLSTFDDGGLCFKLWRLHSPLSAPFSRLPWLASSWFLFWLRVGCQTAGAGCWFKLKVEHSYPGQDSSLSF